MAVYTVHLPKGSNGEAASAEQIVFLRDGFSMSAFVFGPLWLAWNRAWLAASLSLLALILLTAAGSRLELPSAAISVAGIAVSLAFALEGSRLVAWTLARRGYVESAVVVGENLDEVEEAFFNSWRAAAPVAPPLAPAASPSAASSSEPVVSGLGEERET
ncbi:MAG: DUF2628 domain-containing protein [Methylocystis sp.]|nr:DUF2628 domain-containing protein [Methylocystis sp.]